MGPEGLVRLLEGRKSWLLWLLAGTEGLVTMVVSVIISWLLRFLT